MSLYKISNTFANDLASFLADFSESTLKKIATATIFYRGQEYYEEERIVSFDVISKQHIEALVEGNYDDYTTELRLRNGDFEVACTCPYFYENGLCKHIVALILYAKDNLSELEGAADELVEMPLNEADLQKLSKKDLINLLLEKQKGERPKPLSPTQQKSLAELIELFERNKDKIASLLNSKQYLRKPDAMEKAIVRNLKNLICLWRSELAQELGTYLLQLMEEILELQEEGGLFDYKDGNEIGFEGDQFNEYVISFLEHLPFEAKMRWISKYTKIQKQASLITFYDIKNNIDFAFPSNETQQLKDFVFANINANKPLDYPINYYKRLKNDLNPTEKQSFLKNYFLQDEMLLQDYITLMKDDEREQLEIFQAYWEKTYHYNTSKTFLQNYLNLLVKANKPQLLEKVIYRIIKENFISSDNLQELITILPQYANTLKNTLKSGNPCAFLEYCIKNNNLQEGLELIPKIIHEKVLCSEIFKFYAHFKDKIPQEACAFFIEDVRANLLNANEYSYNKVKKALTELYEIDQHAALNLLQHIRKNYSRRGKMMTIMNEMEQRWRKKS